MQASVMDCPYLRACPGRLSGSGWLPSSMLDSIMTANTCVLPVAICAATLSATSGWVGAKSLVRCHVWVRVCVCGWVCLYCICIWSTVHLYIHTDTDTDTYANIHAFTRTHAHTHRLHLVPRYSRLDGPQTGTSLDGSGEQEFPGSDKVCLHLVPR